MIQESNRNSTDCNLTYKVRAAGQCFLTNLHNVLVAVRIYIYVNTIFLWQSYYSSRQGHLVSGHSCPMESSWTCSSERRNNRTSNFRLGIADCRYT